MYSDISLYFEVLILGFNTYLLLVMRLFIGFNCNILSRTVVPYSLIVFIEFLFYFYHCKEKVPIGSNSCTF